MSFKIFHRITLLIMMLSLLAYAGCEQDENNKKFAYDFFIQAQTLYDNGQYEEAYATLDKSFQQHSNVDLKKIILDYTCVYMAPGPYAPIKKVFHNTKEFDFDRYTLGKNIKKFLYPAPYVFIEYKKNNKGVSVTVANALKNARGNIKGRLPLDTFTVTFNAKDSITFDRVEGGKSATKQLNSTIAPSAQVQTTERYGFQLN